MTNNKILITGGAGMIGSHLIDELLKDNKNCQIIILDDFSVGSRNNVPSATNIKVVDSNVLDSILLDNLVEQVDIVYHLATLKKGSDADSSLPTLDTIVGSARVVLEACLKHSVRLVLASTSDVYGYGVKLPFLEDDPISIGPFNSRRWAYAVAKLYTEQLTNEFVKMGLDARIIRYFGGFSERSSFTWRGGHVPKFAYNAYTGIDIEIHGDGLQTRCVTHGSDLAKGTLLVGKKEGITGEVFNIGSEEELTVVEAAKRVLLQFPDSKTSIKHIDTEEVFGKYREIQRRRPNLTKAKEILGYKPSLTFNQGINILLKHLEKNVIKENSV
jgi:UDP-glucose 4-epimerase